MKNDPAHIQTDGIIEQMEKRLAKEYAQANREVTAKADDYFRRFALKDKKWRQWVEDGTKTEEQYKQWAKGQVLMGERWEELRDSLADDYVNHNRIAQSVVDGYMPQVYALNHNYATFEVEKGSRINTSYTLYSRESVERLLRDNPKLYKKPGIDLQKKIQQGIVKKWDKQQIQSVMIQGIMQGESIPSLTKRLEAVTGGEHAAAIRNARTMATGVQNAGRMDAYQRANDLGIQTMKTWVATLDNRTRHWHRELDGVTIPVDEPFENEYGKIMFPGDPDADGANVYNCRCTCISSIKGFEIDVTDTDLRYDDALGDMTYDEWLEEHDADSDPITDPEDIAESIRGSYIRRYRYG